MSSDSASSLGSVVLVHGGWSNPGDWQWVSRGLASEGVSVEAPDLPSHRSGRAGLLEDADEVRRVIRSCQPPVVVVGWSYGGEVIGAAADGESAVVRLIFVAAVPRPVGVDPKYLDFGAPPIINADYAAGTYVLNNDWWVYEEKGTTFSPEVQAHIQRNPRRPAAMRTSTDAVPAAAWTSIRSTVMLGADDELMGEDDRRWIAEHFDDVREVDTDHFILFNRPEAIVSVVIEALREAGAH
jgi:pimeloyl-ACP methyl ester carboxylesterase